MNLTLPETWVVSIELIVGLLSAIIVASWASSAAYKRIMAKLENLSMDIEAMKLRNLGADHETQAVKQEQAAQKTTIAVMAERQVHQNASLDRIEKMMGKMNEKLAERDSNHDR
jgi:hypothetical protein